MADLFFVINEIDIASHSVDSTPYMNADNVDDLIATLRQASNASFEWFQNNLLKINAEKCHLFVSKNDGVSINEDVYTIDKSDTEKLLGLKLDKKLTFYDHISDICKKAGRRISILVRTTPYMGTAKKHILMNAFFTSQFSYSANNSKINRFHERSLRIVYDDKHSSCNELLEKKILSLNLLLKF